MIDTLKQYPAMKGSGVSWLGVIPEHWKVAKVRDVAKVINGFPFDSSQFSTSQGYPLIRIRDLNKKRTATRYNGPFVDVAKVEPGDVLIGMDGDFNVGKWLGQEVALLNQRMCCIRSEEHITEEFLGYVLPQPLKEINDVTWSTTVKHLASGQVERIAFALPPLQERSDIVRFLDHADRLSRRYIRVKQTLRSLLEEERQLIVQRAVTRGVQGQVRFKPSGLDWLGEIPEHWQIRRAKYLFREVDDRSTTGTEELLSLRMYQGLVPHREVSTTPISNEALVGFKKIEPGQMVMNRMRAAIGMFGVARQPGLVSPDYAVFEAEKTINIEFFVNLFKTPAARTVLRLESKGLGTGSSGFLRLYTDRFGTIKLPVPPRAEQDSIMRFIESETQEVKRAEEQVNREISLLREYRGRLIADVVTGKLDVREAAAGLPREVMEAKPLDEMEEDLAEDEEPAEDAELEAEET